MDGGTTVAENEAPTLSVEATARYLGIGRSLAYSLAQRGELPGVIRLGQKRLRVSRAALERHLAGPKDQTPIA